MILAVGVDLVSLQLGVFQSRGEHDGPAIGIDGLGDFVALLGLVAEQVAPAARVVPHAELETLKSPEAATPEIVRGVVPAFFTATDWEVLVVPRSCAANVTDDGVT